MAKLTRATQKVFGSAAGTNQIAQFGSLAASSIAYTTDPETIQALSNYLTGWYGAAIGGNSPAIEDMNAICYLYAYQLAYLMQTGVAEWDAETTYYLGSIANDGTGILYKSLINTNLNQALTDTAKWQKLSGADDSAINPAVTPTKVLLATDNGKTFLVNSANGAMQFTLPSPILNFVFTVKDVGGSMAFYNTTIAQAAAESIENYAGTFTCRADYGIWTFNCDGTNYWLV